MKVQSGAICLLVSLGFKNMICCCFAHKLPGISQDIVELVIEGRNELRGELKIENYRNLQSIEILEQSLRSVYSLEIVNNPALERVSLFDNSCYQISKLALSSSSINSC